MNTERDSLKSLSTRRRPGSAAEVFVIAYPTVLTMMTHGLISAADTLMVGRLGVVEMGAVGFTTILLMAVFATFIDGIDIVNTFSSQAFGEGRPDEAARRGWHGLYLAALSWCIMLALYPFFGHLMHLLVPSAEVQAIGADYGRIRLLGAGFMFAHIALASFFRGVGMVRTAMAVSVGMNLLNILLDYVLIFGHWGAPAMGTDGAAWASNISFIAGSALLLIIFLWPKLDARFATRSTARPSLDLLLRMIRVGLPAGIHFFVDAASFTLFGAIIAHIGETALAASQVGLAIVSVIFNSVWGVSIATSTLVGQYIGAGRKDVAERSAENAGRLVLYFTLAVMAVLALAPGRFVSFFSEDESVQALGAMLVYMTVFFGVFNSVGMIAVGALRGAGDTRFPMVVSLVGAWGLYLPLAYWFGLTLGWGVVGAWLAASIYIIGSSAAYVWRFYTGKWKTLTI